MNILLKHPSVNPIEKHCSICTDTLIESSPHGSIDCGHDNFCYQCILDWSEITNRCPLCNERFYKITTAYYKRGVKILREKFEKVKE